MQVRCLSSPSPLCWFAHDRFLGPHTTMYSTSIDPCFMSSLLNHCDNRSEKRPEEASRARDHRNRAAEHCHIKETHRLLVYNVPPSFSKKGCIGFFLSYIGWIAPDAQGFPDYQTMCIRAAAAAAAQITSYVHQKMILDK